METIRKTLKTATWKGVVVVVFFFFGGGGAARSHPSGLRYNLHFIEDKESTKEHTLVRFPLI